MKVVHIERRFNNGEPAIMWCGATVFIAPSGETQPPGFDFVAVQPVGGLGASCLECKGALALFVVFGPGIRIDAKVTRA